MNQFFQQVVYTFGQYDFTVGHLLSLIIIFTSAFGLIFIINRIILPKYYQGSQKDRKRVSWIVLFIATNFSLILSLWAMKLDDPILSIGETKIGIALALKALLVFQIAQLVEFISSKLFFKYFPSEEPSITQKGVKTQPYSTSVNIGNAVKWLIYIGVFIFMFRIMGLDTTVYTYNDYSFNLTSILQGVLIIIFARILVWVIFRFILSSFFIRNKVDVGRQHAFNQLIKYVIYVFAALLSLQALGFEINLILGGAAALLVGVGLGLQQLFNDLASGIILLSDRSVEVGDVVDLGGIVGTISHIGLRSSTILTRDNIGLIIPNSKLVNDNVTNWSHNDDKVRFVVKVGVAYGTDTKLVKKILIDIAKDNLYVLESPSPFVRFIDFGSSSLDFELHFWSRNFVIIEDIKSDIRFEIDHQFRTQNIEIPFPQRDVWQRTK